MKVHQAAELFPMMSDEELADLAEDIKTNGQVHPIIVDADGQLIDGRNRLKACQIAGVKPRFETLNGQDPVAYILSSNVNRRHLSKGQRAMVAALARDLQNLKLSETARRVEVAIGAISEAELVKHYAPDLVDAVLSGATPLYKAYHAAKARRDEDSSEIAQMEQLRAGAPDLAEWVTEERMALTEALAAWQARQRDERERREVANRNLATVLTLLEPGRMSPAERAEHIAPLIEPGTQYEPLGLSVERIDRCLETLAAVTDWPAAE